MDPISEFQKTINALEKDFPYLLIDKIIEYRPEDKLIKALKQPSNSEKYLCGHFPGNPIVPGVLQIMAFRQAATLLCQVDRVETIKINKTRFFKPVRPGDSLIITVQEINSNEKEQTLQCRAEVDGDLCVKGLLIIEAISKKS